MSEETGNYEGNLNSLHTRSGILKKTTHVAIMNLHLSIIMCEKYHKYTLHVTIFSISVKSTSNHKLGLHLFF